MTYEGIHHQGPGRFTRERSSFSWRSSRWDGSGPAWRKSRSSRRRRRKSRPATSTRCRRRLQNSGRRRSCRCGNWASAWARSHSATIAVLTQLTPILCRCRTSSTEAQYLQADRSGLKTKLFNQDRVEFNFSLNATTPVRDNSARQGMPELRSTVEIGPCATGARVALGERAGEARCAPAGASRIRGGLARLHRLVLEPEYQRRHRGPGRGCTAGTWGC